MRNRIPKSLGAVAALVASIVGAGFASGREILDFFSLYGRFAPAFIFLSAALMGLIAARWLHVCHARGTYTLPDFVRAVLPRTYPVAMVFFGLLLWVTNAAMCAGLTEIVSDFLPGPGPVLLCAVVCAVCAVLSRNRLSMLSILGWILLPCMLIFYLLLRQPLPPVSLRAASALPRLSITYAALNIAMASGVIPPLSQKVAAHRFGWVGALTAVCLCGLLLAANAALAPSALLLSHAPLPASDLSARLGGIGRVLYTTVLLSAILSTLISSQRGLADLLGAIRTPAPQFVGAGMGFALSLLGFRAIVGRVYPALGIVAAVLFVILLAPRGRRRKGCFWGRG